MPSSVYKCIAGSQIDSGNLRNLIDIYHGVDLNSQEVSRLLGIYLIQWRA